MSAGNLQLFLTVLRTEGPRAALGRIAFRFLHVHQFVVLRMRLSASVPAPRVPPGIDLREVTPGELDALRAGRDDLPEYFYRDKLETLERCWVGLENGRLGFIAFVSLSGSSGMVRLGATEAELAYIFNLESMRGKGLTTQAVLMIARTLHAEGRTALLAIPHSRNPAIIKSFLKCGFVQIGTIRRYAFLTWPRTPVNVAALPDPAVSAP